MALITCKECKKETSNNNENCMNCGAPTDIFKYRLNQSVGPIALLLAIYFAYKSAPILLKMIESWGSNRHL